MHLALGKIHSVFIVIILLGPSEVILSNLQWRLGVPLTTCKKWTQRNTPSRPGCSGGKSASGSWRSGRWAVWACHRPFEDIFSSKVSKSNSKIKNIPTSQRRFLELSVTFSVDKYKDCLYLSGVSTVCSFGNDPLQSWTASTSSQASNLRSQKAGSSQRREGESNGRGRLLPVTSTYQLCRGLFVRGWKSLT